MTQYQLFPEPFFGILKKDGSKNAAIGMVGGIVDGQHQELFVVVNIDISIKTFEDQTIQVFYHNRQQIDNDFTGISVDEAKKDIPRTTWRRFQKYIKKEQKNLVSRN